MDPRRRRRLIQRMTFALRFSPKEFGLVSADDGSIEIDALLAALNRKYKTAKYTSHEIVSIADDPEGDFSIEDDRVRYIFPIMKTSVTTDSAETPQYLYAAIRYRELKKIRISGLKSMLLYTSPDAALKSFAEREIHPVIIRINTGSALSDGSEFSRAGFYAYITDRISPDHICVQLHHRGTFHITTMKRAAD